MSITQISKIQVRSGNLAEVPQLSTGELGYATDTKQLFIGNEANANGVLAENTEILTQYSKLPGAGSSNDVQFNSDGLLVGVNSDSLTTTHTGEFSYDYTANSGTGLFTVNNANFPGNVTIGTSGSSIENTLLINGTLIANGTNTLINGNLYVAGNTYYNDVDTLVISDPIIVLGSTSNAAPTATGDRGVMMFDVPYVTSDPTYGFMGFVNNTNGITNTFGVLTNATTDQVGYGNVSGNWANFTAANLTAISNVVANSGVFGNTQTSNLKSSTSNIAVYANLIPSADNTYSLGTNLNRWKDLWISGSTIYIGGSGDTNSKIQNFTANGNMIFTNSNGAAVVFGGTSSNSTITVGEIVANDANITGNLSVSGNIIGNISGNITGTITAPGLNTQILFNDGGNVAASANLVFDKSSRNLTANGNVIVTSGAIFGNASGLTSVPGANVVGKVGSATVADSANTVAGVNVTGQVNYSAVANSVAGANVTGIVPNADHANSADITSYANSVAGANVTGQVEYANVANNVSGSNVSGQVNYAAVANSVSLANVSGIGNIASINIDGNASNILYGNGVFATAPSGPSGTYGDSNVVSLLSGFGSNVIITTGNITAGKFIGNGSLLTGITASYASIANSVAGSNVSGAVAYATIANAVAGANVSGTVANATYATTAGAANSVAVANVSGIGNIATVNLNGSSSQILYGTGSWGAVPATYGDSNVVSLLASFGSNTVTTTGKITAGSANVTGMMRAGNAFVEGNITVFYTISVGTVSTVDITTGGAAFPGNLTGDWTLTSGSKLQATYADLAERYSSDENYEPGTVLMIGGDKEVTMANQSGKYKLAGIVSTSPAHILNSMLSDSVIVALTGRVPCKVVGKIDKGDTLSISNIPGVATSVPPTSTGTIIARALENYDSQEIGTIEVKVDRA